MAKKKRNFERIEKIFSHAAALQQSGKLKNTIFCTKNRIYILNQDHTVLLKFLLRANEYYFTEPISFEANDYDSPDFFVKEDIIGFVTHIKTEDSGKKYKRTKLCRTAKYKPSAIVKLFKSFANKRAKKSHVSISNEILSALGEGLSHVEFVGSKKGYTALQRDIYSGSIIKIEEEQGKLKLQTDGLEDYKPSKFPKVGMRTPDFEALFTFARRIEFYFGNKDFVWVESKDPQMKFTGIVSQCIYDQLGKVDMDGRKK